MLAMAAAAVSNAPGGSLTCSMSTLNIFVQINSVLIDQLHPQTTKSGTTEFAGTTLENAYKAYMAILINMRVKGLLKYHTLMHGICMTATCVIYNSVTFSPPRSYPLISRSGGRAIALHGHAAQNDILANVDWENIAD